MKPTNSKTSKSSPCAEMINRHEIVDQVKSCALSSNLLTSQIKYVRDLLRANHDQQKSIQSRYLAFTNVHAGVLEHAVQPLMVEHSQICEDHELLLKFVETTIIKQESFEMDIAAVERKVTEHLERNLNSTAITSNARVPKTPMIQTNLKVEKLGQHCFFCAKPNHVYTECRSADQAQKNFIGKLLSEKKYDFVRFRKRVKNRLLQRYSKAPSSRTPHHSSIVTSNDVNQMPAMPEPTVPYENSADEDRGSIALGELPTVSMINDHTQDLLNSLHNISNLMDLLRN